MRAPNVRLLAGVGSCDAPAIASAVARASGLRDGSRLPREGERPLVILAGASGRLALGPSAGPAEVVVTLFPDGAPPDGAAARN